MVCVAVLIISMLPFFSSFERGEHTAKDITLIASLTAIAVVSRAVFYLVPQVKPIAAVVGVSGAVLGAKRGYLIGALSMFASNFIFGQGAWTPFQMVALGLVGFFAGVFFYGRESKRWLVALYGFFAVVIIYGAIVDLNTIFFTSQQLSLSVVCFVYLSGLPFNLLFGAATAGFLFCLFKPVLLRIERMVKKYRLFDKNEV